MKNLSTTKKWTGCGKSTWQQLALEKLSHCVAQAAARNRNLLQRLQYCGASDEPVLCYCMQLQGSCQPQALHCTTELPALSTRQCMNAFLQGCLVMLSVCEHMSPTARTRLKMSKQRFVPYWVCMTLPCTAHLMYTSFWSLWSACVTRQWC